MIAKNEKRDDETRNTNQGEAKVVARTEDVGRYGEDVSANNGDDRPANLTHIIEQLRVSESHRQIALRQRIRIENSLLAMVRVTIGWDSSASEAARSKVKSRARAVLAYAWHGKGELDEQDAEVFSSVAGLLLAAKPAYDAFDDLVGTLEKSAAKLAKQLPVYAWVKQQKGFSENTLARLVGSLGDLSNYASWKLCCKRMGLAPHRGKLASTWRTGKGEKLSAEEWVELGYAPHRRSAMHMIGDSQVKNRTPYRDLYDARKAQELAREDDGKPQTLGHAHRRAMVVMERRMIRDLWCAWKYGSHILMEAAA